MLPRAGQSLFLAIPVLVLGLGAGCEGECRSGDLDCRQDSDPESPTWRSRGPNEFGPQTSGWDDAPGSGPVFIFHELRVANRGDGVDLDERCRAEGDCVDNGLWMIGDANETLREDLERGELVLLVEIAGLDVELGLDDPSITLKFYAGKNTDQAAGSRVPARIRDGRVETMAPSSSSFPLPIGPAPHPFVDVSHLRLSARLSPKDPAALPPSEPSMILSDVLFGFALPVGTLAQLDNPYCRTMNELCPRQLSDSSILDLVTRFVQPDVDLDQELGLEAVLLGPEGRVGECLDEGGAVVPPTDGDAPWSCATNPRMQDGYSIAFRGSAGPASFDGVR